MSKTMTYQTAMRYDEELMDAAIVEVSPVDASEFLYELSHDKAALYEDYLYENAIVEASMPTTPDMNTADDFGLRACDAKAIGTVNLMKHAGCFSSIDHMALIMKGKEGGGFYAAVFQNRTDRTSNIGLVIKYPDGTQSQLIEILQGELLCAAKKDINWKSTFLLYAKEDEAMLHPYVAETQKRLKGYSAPDMPIDAISILRCLYDYYKYLPTIEHESQEMTIEEIYRAVAISASRLSSNATSRYIEHEDYFRLTSADFKVIAKDMEYLEYKEIINILDEYELIAKLQHTTGRQTKITYKNEHLNVYLVIKNPKRFGVTVKKRYDFPTHEYNKTPIETLKEKEAEEAMDKEIKTMLGSDYKRFMVLGRMLKHSAIAPEHRREISELVLKAISPDNSSKSSKGSQ